MVLTVCHTLHENESQLETLYEKTAQKMQDLYQDCESYLEENFRDLKEKLEVLKASPEVFKALDEGKDQKIIIEKTHYLFFEERLRYILKRGLSRTFRVYFINFIKIL